MTSTIAKHRVVLVSIDGWGITDKVKGNAIHAATTPNIDKYSVNNSSSLYCEIDASGNSVGLPEGNMGNSEVGHLTMGAGRVQYQDLVRINQSIKDNKFSSNHTLIDAFNTAKQSSNGRLHLFGLVSDGGVHSHIKHLFSFLDAAKQAQVPHTYVHVITDGRDTPPSSGIGYIKQLQEYISKIQYGTIVDVCGRYYAMDRDKRWERIETAYNAYVSSAGESTSSEKLIDTIQSRYDNKQEDEFLKPIIVDKQGNVQENDTLIFFNYRSDRMREIVETFGVKKNFDASVNYHSLHIYQMTQYDQSFEKHGLKIIYPPQDMKNVLSEWISTHGLKQFHTAETEKYAHVTFFFNGGREQAFENEDRKLIPSPKVPTYDKAPEMSMSGVGDMVCDAIKSNKYDFIMCNLAAPDMVGHTGFYDAAVVACSKCDEVIGKINTVAEQHNYIYIVTADHGNAEEMEDENGNPKTSHTTNYVPLIIQKHHNQIEWNEHVASVKKGEAAGGLSNVAPTICTIMGLDIPKEMTAKSLVKPLK